MYSRAFGPFLSLLLPLFLAACLFKTAQPVIPPGASAPVLVKAGYLYEIDAKDGSVSAFKLERNPGAPNTYLFYDEDEAKPPVLLAFTDLGGGHYLVQMENQHAEARKVTEYAYEYSLLRIEQGAIYVIGENSERFLNFVEGQGVARAVGSDRSFFPAITVADRRGFIAALRAFAPTAEFGPSPAYYDQTAMQRLHPDKELPKTAP